MKQVLRIEDIGLSEEEEPKVMLDFGAEIVNEFNLRELKMEYRNQIDRIFESSFNPRESGQNLAVDDKTNRSDSARSGRMSKRISEIEDRLKKIQRKNSTAIKNRLRPSLSSSGSSEKERENSASKEMKNNSNIVMQEFSDRQDESFSSSLAHSVIDNIPNKKNRIHKSSFGDYTTTSHKLNEQMQLLQEKTLKNRVSNALEKTEQAFKIYEKFYKKKKW